MIRLAVIFVFLILVAIMLAGRALSYYLDRKQAERRKANATDGVPCVVCGVRVFAEDSDLCLEHRKAMREVDRDTWVPIDDLRSIIEEEA